MIMTLEQNLSPLVSLFVSSRHYNQDRIGAAVIDGDYLIATNGHTLMKAPAKYFNPTYEKITDKFPDYKNIIPEHDPTQVLFTVSGNVINDEANILPRNNEYTECDMCEGDGNLYTVNQKSVDCPDCDGSGNDEFLGCLIPTPKIEQHEKGEPSFYFKIKNTLFNPNLLQNVAWLSIHHKQPISWIINKEEASNVVYVGDIMVIVMPVYKNSEDFKDYKGDLQIIEIPIV